MTGYAAGALCTLFGLALLLAGHGRGSLGWVRAGKPLASLGFASAGISAHLFAGEPTGYGRAIVAAQLLSLLGDLFLLGRNKRVFLVGLGVFWAAHLVFAYAFVREGVSWPVTGAAFGLLAALAVPIGRWLAPFLRGPFRIAVGAYVAIISLMLALAAGLGAAHGQTAAPVGALLFYLSDLFVARERFVKSGRENRFVGLPLYYAAQLILAASILVIRSRN